MATKLENTSLAKREQSPFEQWIHASLDWVSLRRRLAQSPDPLACRQVELAEQRLNRTAEALQLALLKGRLEVSAEEKPRRALSRPDRRSSQPGASRSPLASDRSNAGSA